MSRNTERERRLLLREYIKLERKEKKFLSEKERSPGLFSKVRDKVPEKAMKSLEAAFEKGFFFLFDKGSGLIDKIGGIEKSRQNAEKYHRSLERMILKSTLDAVDRSAASKIRITQTTTALEGFGLGVVGIGLPDIPIFLAMLLKTCYEIAASYGIDYREDEEQPYTLELLKVAFSQGEERRRYSEECDRLGRDIDDSEYVECDVSEEDMKAVSHVLAADMLVGKFIQGQAIVGVIGGVQNYQLVARVARVARIKYKKRFLYRLINREE